MSGECNIKGKLKQCPKCGYTGNDFAVTFSHENEYHRLVLCNVCFFCLADLIKSKLPELEEVEYGD